MDRMELLAALILGFLLDQLLGDPQNLLPPGPAAGESDSLF